MGFLTGLFNFLSSHLLGLFSGLFTFILGRRNKLRSYFYKPKYQKLAKGPRRPKSLIPKELLKDHLIKKDDIQLEAPAEITDRYPLPEPLLLDMVLKGPLVGDEYPLIKEQEDIIDRHLQRYLQQKSFVKSKDGFIITKSAFRVGIPVLVKVRIGPPDENWQALPKPFPEELLSKEEKKWDLSIILAEPKHLDHPIRRSILLPSYGPSEECDFQFQPRDRRPFEGRLVVLHRGRVMQTAILSAPVIGPEEEEPKDGRIELLDILFVGTINGDLDSRSQFDLAFVQNHDSLGRPILTGVSKDKAWISDLSSIPPIVNDLNTLLSRVAKIEKDYCDGLESENNQKLLFTLALLGRSLYGILIEDQIINPPDNRPDIIECEKIQIVTTRSDAMVPFEFIYDYETPKENARLCSRWREAIKNKEKKRPCFNDCDIKNGNIVCPMGFWGLKKVIERHAYTPNLSQGCGEVFLQAELAGGRDALKLGENVVVGHSNKVDDANFQTILNALKTEMNTTASEASDWNEWASLVQGKKPNLLLALPHTDGSGYNASLEIGGNSLKSIQVEGIHVRDPKSGIYPLVILLGCDTKGTAQDYIDHVAVFRRKGAGIVIGTIATVFGEHAVKVAEMIVTGLSRKDESSPERLGELLRWIKCEAMLKSLPMALCVAAFGDADWKLK